MLFLSQPVGVGFSYEEKEAGSENPVTGAFMNASVAKPDGIYPVINVTAIDTTDLAAMAAWEVFQGFLGALPQLDPGLNVKKEFNLWTESYGGHYGPSFYNYFYNQNQLIAEVDAYNDDIGREERDADMARILGRGWKLKASLVKRSALLAHSPASACPVHRLLGRWSGVGVGPVGADG